MKRALASALAVAMAMAAARPASASTAYLSWQNQYETGTFTDLDMDVGNNYQSCNGNSVAVGLTAAGSNIQTVSLLCANIVRTNSSMTTTIDRSTVPARGNPNQVMNMGRWLGGDNGPNNTCPDGQMMMGASCTGNDCTNMAIYCAAVAPDAPGQQVAVQTPQMTPGNDDSSLYSSPGACGWGGTISAGDRASCPTNKVLAGLQCSGKRCSQISLYCCPLIEQAPQDCQYSQWSPSGQCQLPKGSACGAGTQSLTRQVSQQAAYGGAACQQDFLTSSESCSVACSDTSQPANASTDTSANNSSSPGGGVTQAGAADVTASSASNGTTSSTPDGPTGTLVLPAGTVGFGLSNSNTTNNPGGFLVLPDGTGSLDSSNSNSVDKPPVANLLPTVGTSASGTNTTVNSSSGNKVSAAGTAGNTGGSDASSANTADNGNLVSAAGTTGGSGSSDASSGNNADNSSSGNVVSAADNTSGAPVAIVPLPSPPSASSATNPPLVVNAAAVPSAILTSAPVSRGPRSCRRKRRFARRMRLV